LLFAAFLAWVLRVALHEAIYKKSLLFLQFFAGVRKHSVVLSAPRLFVADKRSNCQVGIGDTTLCFDNLGAEAIKKLSVMRQLPLG